MKITDDDMTTQQLNPKMQGCYDGIQAGKTKAAVRVEDMFAGYPTDQYGDVIKKNMPI